MAKGRLGQVLEKYLAGKFDMRIIIETYDPNYKTVSTRGAVHKGRWNFEKNEQFNGLTEINDVIKESGLKEGDEVSYRYNTHTILRWMSPTLTIRHYIQLKRKVEIRIKPY